MKNLLPFLMAVALPLLGYSQDKPTELNKKLSAFAMSVTDEFAEISEERKATLRELGDYIYEEYASGDPVRITVICTHNSRRSHIGQLWLAAASEWYGFDDLLAYSGGTEATAFNPRAVAALKRAGFKMSKTRHADNPVYKALLTKGAANSPGILMFSKKFDDSQNPKDGFAAIMVCSDADKSCPTVPGAEARFSLPFDDPRYFDGTASEKIKYDETTRLIAREMFFAMHHAKERAILDKERQKS